MLEWLFRKGLVEGLKILVARLRIQHSVKEPKSSRIHLFSERGVDRDAHSGSEWRTDDFRENPENHGQAKKGWYGARSNLQIWMRSSYSKGGDKVRPNNPRRRIPIPFSSLTGRRQGKKKDPATLLLRLLLDLFSRALPQWGPWDNNFRYKAWFLQALVTPKQRGATQHSTKEKDNDIKVHLRSSSYRGRKTYVPLKLDLERDKGKGREVRKDLFP